MKGWELFWGEIKSQYELTIKTKTEVLPVAPLAIIVFFLFLCFSLVCTIFQLSFVGVISTNFKPNQRGRMTQLPNAFLYFNSNFLFTLTVKLLWRLFPSFPSFPSPFICVLSVGWEFCPYLFRFYFCSFLTAVCVCVKQNRNNFVTKMRTFQGKILLLLFMQVSRRLELVPFWNSLVLCFHSITNSLIWKLLMLWIL